MRDCPQGVDASHLDVCVATLVDQYCDAHMGPVTAFPECSSYCAPVEPRAASEGDTPPRTSLYERRLFSSERGGSSICAARQSSDAATHYSGCPQEISSAGERKAAARSPWAPTSPGPAAWQTLGG